MMIKGNAYSCELNAAPNVRVDTEIPVHKDTAVYAVKHLIAHSPALRRVCTSRSYRLRMGGKDKKSRMLVFEIPAQLMGLPGSAAKVILQVTQTGVTITSVSLKNSVVCSPLQIAA